jgi:hypothetical protein
MAQQQHQQQQQQVVRPLRCSRCGPRLLQQQQLLLLSRRRCRSSCWQAGSRAGCQPAAVSARPGCLRLLLLPALLYGSSGSSSRLIQWSSVPKPAMQNSRGQQQQQQKQQRQLSLALQVAAGVPHLDLAAVHQQSLLLQATLAAAALQGCCYTAMLLQHLTCSKPKQHLTCCSLG